MLVVLLSAIDATVLAAALPTIVGDLHGVRDIAWVTTSFMLAQLAVTPIYGKLGDIHGSKLVLQAAIVIFLVGSVLCGLSQTMLQLIAARAVQGAGAGGLMVLVQTIVSTLVAPRERAKYQSWFAAVYGVAAVGGPLLGGVLVQQLSWRWIFFVNVPVGIAAEVVLAIVLQAPPRRRTQAIDWRGAASIAGSLSCFAALVTLAGNTFPWLSWPSAVLAVAALSLAAAAYRVERAAADPVIPAIVVRNRVFRNGMVQTAAIGAVMFGVVTFTPLYFQVVKRDSPTVAGVLLAAMMVGMISAGLWAGRRVSKTGRYRSYPILGFGAMTVGLLMLATVGTGTPTALVCVALAIAGAGLGMTMQLILTVVQSALPRELMGTTTSAMQVGRGVGNSVGPALLGAVFATGLGSAAVANPGFNSHVDHFVRNAYVAALRPVYLAATVFALAGLGAAWRLDELPLSSAVAPADAAEAAPVQDVPPSSPARRRRRRAARGRSPTHRLISREKRMTSSQPAVESSVNARPIAQRSVVDLVIDEVRRLVLEGTLKPGSTLSITELSNRLQVSHIPVREALRRLETEGLIELRRSRSAVVADLSVPDVTQVFHLRTLLESDLLARAVKRYTDEYLAECSEAWEALAWAPDDTAEQLSARHVEFHRRLYLPALTEWDIRVGEILWQASERYIYLILGSAEVLSSALLFRDAHRPLLDAALQRSVKLARKATADHNASGVELISRLLAARE